MSNDNVGILTHTKGLFVSSAQSGATGTGLSTFSRFKVCFTSNPLTCGNGEVNKISLSQFSAMKNWYTVNKSNNVFRILYTKGGVTNNINYFSLDEQDYGNIGDVATNFATKLAAALTTIDGTRTYTASGQQPVGGFIIGNTGKRSFKSTLTANGSPLISNIRIQCPQFRSSGNPERFSDSYVLLGGVRVGDEADLVTSSFKITTGTNIFNVLGHFPMVLQTMPFIYLHCNIAATNLQTQSLGSAQNAIDNHVETSTLLAKIPCDVEFCSAQFDTSTPYFIVSTQRNITELLFQALDHHGREIPFINDTGDAVDIEKDGNLFSDMVVRHEVLNIGSGNDVLNAPFKTFNYQINQANRAQMIGGGGF